MIGILIAATGLSSLEGVYCLGVEPVVFDAAVQGRLLELFVHAATEPGCVIPDLIELLTKVGNVALG